jgi:hypothetical protein
VIKLHGNFIENEQIKQRVKMFLNDIDVLNDEDVVTCYATKRISKEYICRDEELKDYAKQELAVALGKYLLDQGFLNFVEREERHCIKIDGAITVINAEKGGAE